MEFEEPKKFWNNALEKLVGLDYDERKHVAGGNSKIKNNDLIFQHSTPVSGLLAATRNNAVGIDGYSNYIKIMPVVMVAYGDEHDEDVAKAIKYAVDNGAQIINMSWGKYYSTKKELVKEAFKYAENNNVLLVSGSGNDSKNTDVERNYPTDFYDEKEVTDNFINVGGITHKMDSTLVSSFSNYGVAQVDIMAPASAIYSSDPDNTYSSSDGTSFASPMVAGTAALLKSYFPKLTAVQLKEIILTSGTKLDIMVKRPGDDKNEPLVPFSTLSKTGSILNTYAAFKKAAELSE
jgi:subtilisin family serine protease